MPAGSTLFKLLVAATLLLGSLTILIEMLLTERSPQVARGRRTPRRRFPFWARLHRAATVLFGHDQPSVSARSDQSRPSQENSEVSDRLHKTEAEWQDQLTDEQFRVTRCSGTERPFTGAYYDHHADGTYLCVCCENELFTSEAKYDSGSGWPSFWKPVSADATDEIKDISYGMVRTEIICNRCEAHLGHVFPDGPKPTGLRYCISSAALNFVGADAAVG